MANIPSFKVDLKQNTESNGGLTPRLENPVLARVLEERRRHLRQPQDQDPYLPDRVVLEARVLIIEGIPGSGKDTFQAYLRRKLEGRDVYDYSEGELLHSWKHVPIKGILKLRVKFIKLFVNYLKDIVSKDDNAIFLLNRFHLSTYVSTIIKQPSLEREYNEIINVLKTLPVHVFILQLDENEVERRSAHSERSSPWQKYQRQRVTKDGFSDTLKRYMWQQNLITEVAKKQSIPYSVIKLPTITDIDGGPVRVPEVRSRIRRGGRTNAIQAKI